MYSLGKIAKLLGCGHPPHLPITECAIDSRLVSRGGLFFALEGKKSDGHLHLKEVAERGAYAAVVKNDYAGDHFGLVLLRVSNVLESLHHLAREIHRERKTRVIAITGSVGKTSTREVLFKLISRKYKVYSSPHSYNSQATLPLVILNAPGGEDFLLLEMAMSEKGQIKKLVEIAPPEFVILTEVSYAHVENFCDLNEIAAAKAEVFTSSVRFAVIHERSAQFEAVQVACTSENEIYPKPLEVKSPFVETHLSENYSAAVVMAQHLGLTIDEIERRSIEIKPFKSRFEKKVIKRVTFIDDTYNASFPSVIGALKNIPHPKAGGKRIAVLGSMKELGKYCGELHQKVGEEASLSVDLLFAIGEEMKESVDLFNQTGKKGVFCSDQNALYESVKRVIQEGDVVLVKGARSHNLTHLVERFEKEALL